MSGIVRIWKRVGRLGLIWKWHTTTLVLCGANHKRKQNGKIEKLNYGAINCSLFHRIVARWKRDRSIFSMRLYSPQVKTCVNCRSIREPRRGSTVQILWPMRIQSSKILDIGQRSGSEGQLTVRLSACRFGCRYICLFAVTLRCILLLQSANMTCGYALLKILTGFS